MDGQAYFQQEVENGHIIVALTMLAQAQEINNEEAMFMIFQGLVAKAFEDGVNHESDLQYEDGNALHR